MGYGPWGRKRIGHDLATKQQQLSQNKQHNCYPNSCGGTFSAWPHRTPVMRTAPRTEQALHQYHLESVNCLAGCEFGGETGAPSRFQGCCPGLRSRVLGHDVD